MKDTQVHFNVILEFERTGAQINIWPVDHFYVQVKEKLAPV